MIGAGGHSLSIDHEDSVSATGKLLTIQILVNLDITLEHHQSVVH